MADSVPATAPQADSVLRFAHAHQPSVTWLIGQLGLQLRSVASGADIPGSFWGDEEAGLIGNQLFVRPDTPVHSLLHEACHFVCMDDVRKQTLHTNAGGTHAEENAVCYLQILLANALVGMGQVRMFDDMDSWGYSFRLGSAQKWFEQDAADARQWLVDKNLLQFADRLIASAALV